MHAGYSDTSFLATFDTDPITPTNPTIFNYAVLNPGGHYDVTTGIYTVPIDGIYEIIFHFRSFNDNTAQALRVDGTRVSVEHVCKTCFKQTADQPNCKNS